MTSEGEAVCSRSVGWVCVAAAERERERELFSAQPGFVSLGPKISILAGLMLPWNTCDDLP